MNEGAWPLPGPSEGPRGVLGAPQPLHLRATTPHLSVSMRAYVLVDRQLASPPCTSPSATCPVVPAGGKLPGSAGSFTRAALPESPPHNVSCPLFSIIAPMMLILVVLSTLSTAQTCTAADSCQGAGMDIAVAPAALGCCDSDSTSGQGVHGCSGQRRLLRLVGWRSL